MDTPATKPPAPPSPAPSAPAASTPVAGHQSRSAQFTLAIVLAATLALLVYRGYGNSFGTRPTEQASASLTNLNKADRAELEQVPGIGPTLAREIEDHRKKKGPFKSMDELRQVKGIGPVTLDKIRPFLRIEPADLPQSDSSTLEPLVLERKPTTPTVAPAPRSSGGSKKLQPGDPPIDLNTAGATDLVRLPGVGPVTADHIIAARGERPFSSVNDLTRVKGIGQKTLEKIRPFVVVK